MRPKRRPRRLMRFASIMRLWAAPFRRRLTRTRTGLKPWFLHCPAMPSLRPIALRQSALTLKSMRSPSNSNCARRPCARGRMPSSVCWCSDSRSTEGRASARKIRMAIPLAFHASLPGSMRLRAPGLEGPGHPVTIPIANPVSSGGPAATAGGRAPASPKRVFTSAPGPRPAAGGGH